MSTKLRSALSVRSPVYNHIILRTWHRIHLTEKFALTSQVLRASGQVSSIRGMCWSACAKSTETLRCMISGKIWHYNDVIMNAMASQITSLTIVYSTVYSGIGKKKKTKLRVTVLCAGNSPVTGEFPAQRVSNAENVSIWWRLHERGGLHPYAF